MNKYHKIQTIFKRNPEDKFKTLLEGQYSLPELEYLADNEWVFTEKIDGTNIRVMINGDNITFGGKTDNAQIPSFLVTHLNNTFMATEKRKIINAIFDCPLCLYGEGYGAKIQKGGGNYRKDQSFVLFDIKVGNWWLKRSDVEDIARKLEIEVAPVVGCGTLKDAINLTNEGMESKWGNFISEGLVLRPRIELFSKNGSRIITKIKHKDFNNKQ